MKELYFIRHGLSLANEQGLYSGRSDTPLSDKGRQQILEAAKSMPSLDIQAIVCSSSIRTIECAKLIAQSINYPVGKIYVNDLFEERNLGVLEDQPYKQGEIKDDIEGIEQSGDLLKRAGQAYDWLKQIDADKILVVGHGSFGRALRAVVLPDKYTYFTPEYFQNAVLVKLL